jgi:diaminopimelate decarboxylase
MEGLIMIETVNGTLYFDGCNTVELAKKYKTPLYVVSDSILREKGREVRDSFLNKYENVRAVYASKALLNLAMCKIVQREGLGLDVVSGGELYIAISSNFPMDDIIFHGNNKSKEELIMAVKYGVGRIVVDSLSELELLEEICKNLNKEADILFRITPEVSANTHRHISTGQKDSKFGIPLLQIDEAIKIAIYSNYINFKGIHFHVGSQLFSNESHLKALRVAIGWIEHIKNEYDYEIEDLNIGGGFGIKYVEGDIEVGLNEFLEPVMNELECEFERRNLKRPCVIIEPGRWFVGSAGITLYNVGSIKNIEGVRKYVSIDGGLSDNPRVALYDAKYSAIVANKANTIEKEVVTIGGKCCESGDILIKDIELPILDRNDILAVLNTGAYNDSMSSNYNKALRPAIVLVSEGNSYVIKKRENYEDLISKDVIPQCLINLDEVAYSEII